MDIQQLLPKGRKVILNFEEAACQIRFHPVIEEAGDEFITLVLPDQWNQWITLSRFMRVRLSIVKEECIWALPGEILEVESQSSRVKIAHRNDWERLQRRTFYRIEAVLPIRLCQIVLPNGNLEPDTEGSLIDISAGGAGFRLDRFLPSGTKLVVPELFARLTPGDRTNYSLELHWCRKEKKQNFRAGGAFNFTHSREQDRMVRRINQLQIQYISRYCRILGDEI